MTKLYCDGTMYINTFWIQKNNKFTRAWTETKHWSDIINFDMWEKDKLILEYN